MAIVSKFDAGLPWKETCLVSELEPGKLVREERNVQRHGNEEETAPSQNENMPDRVVVWEPIKQEKHHAESVSKTARNDEEQNRLRQFGK